MRIRIPKKRISSALAAVFAFSLVFSLAGCAGSGVGTSSVSGGKENGNGAAEAGVGKGYADPVNISDIPAYSGKPYVAVDDNIPNFGADELDPSPREEYSPLDRLGRCGAAFACCGLETMPKDNEERGDISGVKPSGWQQAKYDCVDGGYLYSRAHLIGWQLSAENANERNLVTGTVYFNTKGMLPFENMIADYIKETKNHVAYRVTPVFEGDNLVCDGVQMEAYSIEDRGEGVCFNVFCYNVQPLVSVDYATGKSTDAPASSTGGSQTSDPGGSGESPVWITSSGKKYHSDPECGNMKNPRQVTLDEAVGLGYEPCKKCY